MIAIGIYGAALGLVLYAIRLHFHHELALREGALPVAMAGLFIALLEMQHQMGGF